MNASKMALTLAALLAVPAMAQEARAPSIRQLKIEIEAPDADFAAVLVAAGQRIRPLADQWVLADATACLLLMKKKKKSQFLLDMDVPDAWQGDLYWQAATYDATSGLRLRPVRKFEIDVTPVEVDAGDDGSTRAIVCLAVRGASEVGDEPNLDKVSPDADWPCLPIELQLTQCDDGSGMCLHARFEAPSDGYRLTFHHVDINADTGFGDVYLYRKLPGPGEGMLDVVEHHEAIARLGQARGVRVFFAQGTAKKPQDSFAWSLIAKLRQ